MKATVTMQDIPFNKLIPTKNNIRKTNLAETEGETAASSDSTKLSLDPSLPRHIRALAHNILAHGLLQPLGVAPHSRKAGHYVVHFGNRRYMALAALVKAKHLQANAPVSCRVSDSAAALSEALSENVLREAMHPLDEAEAFCALVQEGLNLADIADRFGVTIRVIQQRLRLADLHPDIAQAYRDRTLRLEQVQALACTPDQEAQRKAFERGLEYSWLLAPGEIRRFLQGRGVNGRHRLALYVGRDAYLAAGGVIEETLFDEADLWQSAALLESLASEKLQAEACALVEAGQYGDVRPLLQRLDGPTWQDREGLRCIEPAQRDLSDEDIQTLNALEAELQTLQELDELTDEEEENCKEIEQKIEALENPPTLYPSEVAANAIAFLCVNDDGQSEIWHELYTQVRPASAQVNPENTEDDSEAPHEASPPSAPVAFNSTSPTVPAGKPLSAALLEDLAVQRSQVLAAALSNAPDMAHDALVFMLASQLLAPSVSFRNEFGFDMRAQAGIPERREPNSHAAQYLQDKREKLPTAWLEPSDLATRFIAFRTLSADQKADLLTFCVTLMCQPGLNPTITPNAGLSSPFQDLLGQMLKIAVRDWWSPTASSYWSRMTRDQCLEALDAIDASHLRHSYGTQKKHSLAEGLERLFRGEGHVGEKVSARARSWAPPLLTFAALAGFKATNIDDACAHNGPDAGESSASATASQSLEDAA